MADARKNRPEHISVNPLTVACPRCKAAPGTPCDVLDDFDLIHLERINKAAAMEAAKKTRPN